MTNAAAYILVENLTPCTRSFGGLYLNPGINKVPAKVWEKLKDSGYKKAINGYEDEGILFIHSDGKPSIAVVQKTYDIEVLNEWLANAKGPLKGAITKQLEILEIKGDKKED